MKQLMFLFTLLVPIFAFGQRKEISKTVVEKFASCDLSQIKTVQHLAKNIAQLTPDKKEQLQMLLLWTYQNMNADSNRFFHNTNPLTTSESLEKRVALCDEFSNILTEFCQSLNIPSLRIEGYVKYLDFKAGAKFEECNHAWNAVYIGSTWYLCDLFWSTSVLKIKAFASSRFEKAMNTKYFLASPDDFLDTHLPCSPVFQFNAHPISISTFSSLGIGVDTIMSRMRFYNYNDSLKTLVAMRPADRVVKIAQQAYAYNPANPNLLIIEYYNYAIEVLNNKKATKLELKKAKAYLGSALKLFDQSKKEEVMALKEICKKGIFAADRRLARS